MEQINAIGGVTALIHYVFQTDPELIACMPNMAEFHQTPYHPNYQRSNAPSAVTCPACKKWFAKKQEILPEHKDDKEGIVRE